MVRAGGSGKSVKTDALIAALTAKPNRVGQSPGMTTQELAIQTGKSHASIMKRLHELRASGQLRVAKVMREDITGGQRPHTVYWVESPTKRVR